MIRINAIRTIRGVYIFCAYLGDKRTDREAWDATCLVQDGAKAPPMLVDQGTADEFLAEQLFPHNLQAACEAAGLPLTLRLQEGYDHSYHFIASFIGEHLAWHAEALNSSG